MTGARALAGHGRWLRAGDYGEVWEPDVPASYVPYRRLARSSRHRRPGRRTSSMGSIRRPDRQVP